MDEWKDIDGFENIYKVNRNGEVYSSYIDRPLKPVLHGQSGYHAVCLYKGVENGKKIYRQEYVHRLVAQTFIDNPENLPEVNHKDGNKYNNRVSNLEWCTDLENKLHARKTGLISDEKRTKRSDGMMFDSLTAAAKSVKGDMSNISKVCRGVAKTAYGYGWEYV